MGGRPKALLPLPGGHTFLTRIVETFSAAGVSDIVIVLGHEADAVQRTLDLTGAGVRTIVNGDYLSGQFSSVLAGLDAVDKPGIAALLMTLVDVPLVTPATVRSVVARFEETGAPIVRPV